MKQNYIEKKLQTIYFLNSREVLSTTANIFLNQNMGKGPPGYICNSGGAKSHCPENTQGLANLIAIKSSNRPKQIYKLQLINYLIINKSNHSLIFKLF